MADKLDALRKTQRDLLRVFVETCEREGLSYFAMFGTMIGAVRHGGFIPWDDDIDVAMPRVDYTRLISIADKFEAPYFLQTPENDPGACPRYVRLMNLDTTFIPPWYPAVMLRGGRMGCRIDILPLDEVPDKFKALRLAGMVEGNWRLRCRRAPLEEMPLEEMPDWKRKGCHMLNPESYGNLTRRYHELCALYAGQGAEYYTIPIIYGQHRALLLPKRCFERYSEMVFDGLRLRVPEGHAELSDIIYENGAELPAEDERESKHAGFFDTEKPYTKYTARYEKVFEIARGKKIVLFGAGNMLKIYMERYGVDYPPLCTFDNDSKKWGKSFYGVPVLNPADLSSKLDSDTVLIIISLYHREIGKQLEAMGIFDYCVYVDGWKYVVEYGGSAVKIEG